MRRDMVVGEAVFPQTAQRNDLAEGAGISAPIEEKGQFRALPSPSGRATPHPEKAPFPEGSWRITPNIFREPALTFGLPADTDMILVCVDTFQHTPVAILLPHQLSVERAEELLDKHGASSLTVMPYKNAHKIEVTRAALSKATGGQHV